MADQGEAQSPQERMMALLGDNGELTGIPDKYPEEAEESAEIAEPDQPEEVELEADVEDSEEQTDEPQTVRLIHNGVEIEKPLDEVKSLAQQGFDYTQKTQKLAEERKQVEQYAQVIKAQEQMLQQQAQLQQAFIKEIAKVEGLNEQIAQYENLDWNALSDNDPVQAQKHWIQYQTLQNKRTQAQNEIQQKQTKLSQQQEQFQAQRLAEARSELLKAFPDWNAQKASELRETGKNYGFTDEELSGLTDHRSVKLLADAAAYRKLQANKGSVQQKVQNKPAVVKPGAKDTKAVARTQIAVVRAQLRKTGDRNIAAKLIERLL